MNKGQRIIQRAKTILLLVAGNVFSGGDIAMMEYSKGRAGPSLREFAYSEKNNASLNAAKKYGFTVMNIKRDWKTIFVFGQAALAK